MNDTTLILKYAVEKSGCAYWLCEEWAAERLIAQGLVTRTRSACGAIDRLHATAKGISVFCAG